MALSLGTKSNLHHAPRDWIGAVLAVLRSFAAVTAVTLGAAGWPQTAVADPSYRLHHSGRLAKADGSPVQGAVEIVVRFWDSATNGQQLSEAVSAGTVELQQGVFSAGIELSGDAVAAIFGDGTWPVYIETTANGVTYPRQSFSFIPYALRTPVDDRVLRYGSDGKLSLAVTGTASPNKFLTVDGSGRLGLQSPVFPATATSIQGQNVAATPPSLGQILTFDGTAWAPVTPPAASSGLNELSVTAPLVKTGAASTTTLTLPQASSISSGYLSESDWLNFSSKLSLSGGALSGPLSLSGNALNSVGALTMTSDSLLGLGVTTQNPPGLSSDDQGKVWFDGTLGRVRYFDGATVQTVGVDGGLRTLNGVTGESQSFATGAIGSEPNFVSANGVHTLNIPRASSSGVTGGLLSNSDYQAFGLKVGQIISGIGISVSAVDTSRTISLAPEATPGTYSKVFVDQYGRALNGSSLSSSDIPELSTDILTSGTLPVGRGGTGITTAPTNGQLLIGSAGRYQLGSLAAGALGGLVVANGNGQIVVDTVQDIKSSASPTFSGMTISGTQSALIKTNAAGLIGAATPADIGAALGYTPINKAGDSFLGLVNLNGNDLVSAGNLQMAASKTLGLSAHSADPTGLANADKGKTWFNTSTNQIKFWDGSNAIALGIAGSGLGTLNGQTGNTQTFGTPGTTGLSPAWSSLSNTHTLNIPLASAGGVTAGLLSNVDYASFSGKVGTVASGTGISVSTASGTATVSLAAAGTVGTYAKVTTDTYGRVTSGTTLSPADIPPHSAALITSGAVAVANGGTGATSLAANSVMLGNGTSAVQVVAPGASGNVLTSNGTTWQSTILPWAAPGTIGSTTPNTGAFTSLTSNSQAGYEAKPFGTAAGNTGEVRFDELIANGINYVGFKAPDTLAANKIWVLPGADGTAGQVLKTDGTGNLSWVTAATGSVTSVGITAPAAGITVTGGPITSSGSMTLGLSNDIAAVEALSTTGLAKRTASDTWTTVTDNSANWDIGFTDRLKWDGGATGLVAATGRTSLGLGGLATLSAVGSTEVTDGSIANADISLSAAIADSKLATITTAGKVSGTAITSGNITTSGAIASSAQGAFEAKPFGTAAGNTSEVRFDELAANGASFVGFKAPDSLAADKIWTLPGADGTAGQVLKTDGAGNLSWVSTAVGSVTNVTGMAPISVATGTSTPVISISQANGATSGFLSAADWTTFNAKQAAGNYITQLTGDMTLSGFASGTATATLPSVAIAGTSTKVTYDVKGRVLSGTSLAAADIPALSAAIITSGTLNVANGGTGANSLTLNNVILGNGTSPVQAVAPGTNGNVLTSNGTTWESTAIPATTWATPGTIGSNTPNTGAFTSITSNAQAGYEAKPFGVNAGNTGEVRFDELAANGTNYIGFKAPDILAANKVWVLPAADGTAGQVLKTDGVGNLSWVSAATGSVTSVGITAPASGITVTGGPITSSGSMTLALSNDIAAVEALTTTGLAKRTAADSWTTVTDNSSNWDAAYSDRLKWDGGSTDLNAATARTSLGLGSLATMSAVGGSEVTDGSLTNSDIAAAAGIADSKLATISTAGKVSGSAITSGTIGGSTALSTSGNITTSGNVGIGTTMPSTKLHVVGGQAASGFASNTTGTINWNSGNIQTTSVAAGTLTMSNMVDGAGYTLVINNATGGNYTLSGTGLTFRCSPSCPIVVTAGADTVVAMVKGGTTVWVAWNKGFQ